MLPVRQDRRHQLRRHAADAVRDAVSADRLPAGGAGRLAPGELTQIPGVKGAHNYVLDGNGVVIASTNPARPAGYRFHTAGPAAASCTASSGEANGHYFDQVLLTNSTWRVLLTAPNGALFASVSGLRKWLPWLIFVAFGIVAIVTLVLARRALRDTDRVRETNDQLGDANASLAERQVELEDANQTLAETNTALAVSNAELERRAQELARSNAELEQFASIASHDLQEPLRKVRTFTERISRDRGRRTCPSEGTTTCSAPTPPPSGCRRLIEDLLQVLAGRHPGAPVHPGRPGHGHRARCSRTSRTQIDRTGAIVHVGPLPTINADAPQMRQLMQNLISNAIKFRREDVTPEVDVDGAGRRRLGELIIVRDNGIGFDPQYSRRIFRVFERLHGRGTYPGTGIGLALCRKIAERHGGTIVADSVPGEGSTFTVTLQTQRTEAVSDVPPTGDDDSDARTPVRSRMSQPEPAHAAVHDPARRRRRGGPRARPRRAAGLAPGQRDEVRRRRPGSAGLPAPRGPLGRARRSTPRARGSSCSTSTCPRRTGARRWPRSRPTSALRRIPIVVLTTSKDEADVLSTYDLGRQLVHHQAGDVRRPGRGDADLDAVLVRDRRAAQRSGRWPPQPLRRSGSCSSRTTRTTT